MKWKPPFYLNVLVFGLAAYIASSIVLLCSGKSLLFSFGATALFYDVMAFVFFSLVLITKFLGDAFEDRNCWELK